MPNLLIRALPPEVHRALRHQASLNGRSLQREVQAILSEAVDTSAPTLYVSDVPVVGKVGREDVYRDGG